ncbi:hypothetical protein [Paenibacillus contaminans]|uniref:Uncharacterized protein n=1 Tax=Paenibacillus contaminans TaxID=450362 RepID=A0A329MFP4_9BACL|nr:hypothetical protein [Paenibacillus contaminans]RAV18749.1 hypothetical protein DQG23_23725 [Paenibacillus contaminans]
MTKYALQPIHYGLSFIAGKWSGNSVRFWVESRLRFIDEHANTVEDYYQCGSCKSESTFAEKDLFNEDNYDFTPIFGPENGIIYRRTAALNENYKSCPKSEDMWGGQLYKLKTPDSCVLLETTEAIRRATHDNIPLVAQTELVNAELGLRAIIEYPVKTMNIHDERNLYQVDTGPILLPDLTARQERVVDAISLAYVAFNVSHFADFVVEQPTPIVIDEQERCRIHHYSGPISLSATNRLFAVI